MIKIIQKIKDLCNQEKSYIYYFSGIVIFLFWFIYSLFDRTILIEKNILMGLSISIFFLIGFIFDSVKFIKYIWSTYYGKIFHFLVASVVYAISYSLSEKIIFINTQLDPNLLQSSIHLFTVILNIPVWLLVFQIFLIIYTFLYCLIISVLFIFYFIYIFIGIIISEITKNLIPGYLVKSFFYKNKYIRVKIKRLKRFIMNKRKQFIKKLIHAFFFILGATYFITLFSIDKMVFKPIITKENNIIKNIIIFTSFYESNNRTCSNLEENKLVRFYGNSFSKVENKNSEIIFINNIKCE
ncbi:hypothetical protein ACOTVO_06205 [Aliarcobacter butzleri]